MNLADVVGRNAAFTPDKTALRFEGGTLTYGGFADRVGRATSVLAGQCRVGAGDRVAVLALNHPDTLVLLYACARLGAILLPLNWRLAAAELAYILGDAEPSALVVDGAFQGQVPLLTAARPGLRVLGLEGGQGPEPSLAALLADNGAPAGEGPGGLSDPCLLVYTSGTTGRPKGAVLTQEALLWNGQMSQHMHGLTSADHVLTVLPFFHVGGLNIQTTPALHVGATVTLHGRFAAAATLAAIATERPTLTVLVPPTITALLAEPGFAEADLSSLRAVTTGSTYVPRAVIDPLEERGVPVLQVYGATETAPIAIYTRLVGERRRPGSTGWPGPFNEAKIVGEDGAELAHGEAGEILVRGPQVFSGYWRDPAATRAALCDGWFRTGDIATRDADGAFSVYDRKKNMIISGGENIYPAEVERALESHPGVAAAAVIGRPDPRWGETPVAFLVLRSGFGLDPAAMNAHVLTEIARFKAPRRYHVVDNLPRNALGKVQHALLRERADRDLASP